MSEQTETSRVAVKTYVPAYQKDEWREHADELDMTQSEFVRTMVQAGRRGFLEDEESDEQNTEEPSSTETTAGETGDALAERVESALTAGEYYSWDELLAAITDNIEDRLEETLADLQDRNVVRYSGRNGGYTLVET
ncbi:DUF5805 domain-containing protein [Halapricum hydrolyticum]|uniref:DUF5805 domain-containing protein n=1 Tax=Halapricum hydrolyticum TaxID=2979991 RepID=A0AAE3IAP6_9EURY|nr:DUF5805 domain-containing protein [Halapricum hydrolyticum]MCU4717913.1 DUF5805 domain-containing protein [Halapricum hydrolyticum]MCU4727078.1 DUF5805 domain-containing protein [Halapricum hydrolyticum]